MKRLGELHPHLAAPGRPRARGHHPDDAAGHDVVFLALPHGHSAGRRRSCPATTSSSSTAAPTSGSSDAAAWDAFYGTPHAGTWPYGLPELPGRPAAATGAPRRSGASPCPAATRPPSRWRSRPAFAAGLLETEDVVVVAASGTSGAGKAPEAAPARQRGDGLDVAVRRRRRRTGTPPRSSRTSRAPRASRSPCPSPPPSRPCRAASSPPARPGSRADVGRAPSGPRGSRPTPTSPSSTCCPRAQWPATAVGRRQQHRAAAGGGRRAGSAASSSSPPSTTSPRAPPAPPCSAPTSPSVSTRPSAFPSQESRRERHRSRRASAPPASPPVSRRAAAPTSRSSSTTDPTTAQPPSSPPTASRQRRSRGRARSLDGGADAVVLNSGGANACTGAAGLPRHAPHRRAGRRAARASAGDVAVCSTGLIGELLPDGQALGGRRRGRRRAVAARPRGRRRRDQDDRHRAQDGRRTPAPAGRSPAWPRAPGCSHRPRDDARGAHHRRRRRACRPRPGPARCDGASPSTGSTPTAACRPTTPCRARLRGLRGRPRTATSSPRPSRAVSADLARQLIADAEGAAHDIAIEVRRRGQRRRRARGGRGRSPATTSSSALSSATTPTGAGCSRPSAPRAPPSTRPPWTSPINGIQVCRAGGVGEDRALVDLAPREVHVVVDLHAGSEAATVWTNDLTHDYVHENSAYST